MPEHEMPGKMKGMAESIAASMDGAPLGASVTVTVHWTDPRHSIEDYEFTLVSTAEQPIADWKAAVLRKIRDAAEAFDPPVYPAEGAWHGNPTPVFPHRPAAE